MISLGARTIRQGTRALPVYTNCQRLPVFVSCGRACLIRIVMQDPTEWFFVTIILFAGEKGAAAHVLSKISFEGEFQTTNACVTVSLLPAEVIYGDSSTALFRRGGG